MIRLLLHSRDLSLQSSLAPSLGREFNVAIDSSRERVKHLLLNNKCDVIILDLECGASSDQFEFLDELRESGVPVVVVTDGDRTKIAELSHRGVQNYCKKPLTAAELSVMVRRVHQCAVLKQEKEAREELPANPSGCGEMVGSSAGSRAIHELIKRVARVDAFVLITGESGTGKEVIARAIHSMSDRQSHRFVAVSCGAIPESLIEAELFGSEKGAYTGASARRIGYLEQAGDGTLLLDEIGELSHHAQIKLLRVLQQREFMRLGSSTAIPLRARVLFATNKNLKQMVGEGTFREDLYYRVNVVGIQSQPLRDRRDDIAPLAQHFLDKYAASYGRSITSITPEALMLLREYEWPGNVRELENVIQSALIFSDDNGDDDGDDESIGASSLPAELQRARLPVLDDEQQWISFEDQLTEYKTKLAVAAVKECNGNKTLAAQNLNISRTYLHRLLRDPGEDGLALRVA
jgi:two-component system response regulator AtoC